jgi:threonine dehydrogenase-like Zn-dependent dehydrogenase
VGRRSRRADGRAQRPAQRCWPGISIDSIPERPALAEQLGAETINYAEVDSVQEVLAEITGGRGPYAVIEAVGMEAHSTGAQEVYDRAKQLLRMETDRAAPLREAVGERDLRSIRRRVRSIRRSAGRRLSRRPTGVR